MAKVTNTKDKLTNIVAAVTAVLGVIVPVVKSIQTYLETSGVEINVFNLIMAVAVTVVAIFTGRDADGKAKIL